MKYIHFLIAAVLLFACTQTHTPETITDFSALLAPAPKDGGFKIQDYWVWGGSCIKGDDGLYHLYASRWPKSVPFMQGYVFYSGIVHAVSSEPAGPYEFRDIALPVRGEEFWDGRMTHNPSITKYGDHYYLFYIGSTYTGESPSADSLRNIKHIYRTRAYKNIRIGVAKASSPDGPWQRKEMPILAPQPNGFDSVVVTNPAPYIDDTGTTHLVYRTFIRGTRQRLGLARAVHPDSSFTRVLQQPIAAAKVEDPYIWKTGDRFYIVAKDMTGEITGEKHAGVFLSADSLTNWQLAEHCKAWSRTVVWSDGDTTVQGSLERPQLLIENGLPRYLFAATADGPGGFRNADNTWNMAIPLNWENKSNHCIKVMIKETLLSIFAMITTD